MQGIECSITYSKSLKRQCPALSPVHNVQPHITTVLLKPLIVSALIVFIVAVALEV